jgi:hypothetical protein
MQRTQLNSTYKKQTEEKLKIRGLLEKYFQNSRVEGGALRAGNSQ